MGPTPYRAGGVVDWFESTDSHIAPSIRGGLCFSILVNLGWFCDLPWWDTLAKVTEGRFWGPCNFSLHTFEVLLRLCTETAASLLERKTQPPGRTPIGFGREATQD